MALSRSGPIRPHPKPAARSGQTGSMTQEEAESIAVLVLGHIAGEPERLDRFVALSGVDTAHLRDIAGTPGFLSAVLDHLCGNEADLMQFAEEAAIAPARIASARQLLAGGEAG